MNLVRKTVASEREKEREKLGWKDEKMGKSIIVEKIADEKLTQ